MLRVFVGDGGSGGNALGVFLDGAAIPVGDRQRVAAELAFSETVFVDEVDAGGARVAIFTPSTELGFAGHPSIGAAWLLRETGRPVPLLRLRAGDAPVRYASDTTWVRARASWVHAIRLQQMPSAAAVDADPGQPMGQPGRYVWAWLDEASGIVRSRYFGTDIGIPEDEATGAAAVLLGDQLGRPIEIRQGRGSIVRARPAGGGTVEVGGAVVLDEVREARRGADL